jgi:hypothetical protein
MGLLFFASQRSEHTEKLQNVSRDFHSAKNASEML